MIFTHSFFLPLPPERALHLFTPVGERAWAGHWDPHFPAGEHGDGAAPGTVFLTGDTHWVVTDRREDGVRYARVTPGVRAGTVEVRVTAEGPRSARGGRRTAARASMSATTSPRSLRTTTTTRTWRTGSRRSAALLSHLASMGDGDRQGDRAVG